MDFIVLLLRPDKKDAQDGVKLFWQILIPVVIPQILGRHGGDFPVPILVNKDGILHVTVAGRERVAGVVDHRNLHCGIIPVYFRLADIHG